MMDAAKFGRVYLTVLEVDSDKAGYSKLDITELAIAATIDGRPPRNVLLQWEIDSYSLVEQSLTELRDTRAWLAEELKKPADKDTHVMQAFRLLVEWIDRSTRHPLFKGALVREWTTFMDHLKEKLSTG